MANRITITTPRGSIYHMTGKNGKVTARLEWNEDLDARRRPVSHAHRCL